MLRHLILMRKELPPIDFTSPDWEDAALVTPRHAVRRLWNETALLKHGKKAHWMILECKADETIKGELLTVAEKYAVVMVASFISSSYLIACIYLITVLVLSPLFIYGCGLVSS